MWWLFLNANAIFNFMLDSLLTESCRPTNYMHMKISHRLQRQLLLCSKYFKLPFCG